MVNLSTKEEADEEKKEKEEGTVTLLYASRVSLRVLAPPPPPPPPPPPSPPHYHHHQHHLLVLVRKIIKDAFKEISAINFYGRSNVESNIQHAVEKDIGDVDAPKRSRTRNVYYAEESDSDENDPFHDNVDDRDRCYIPEIDCNDEEPKNEVEVAIQIDEEDDVEDALNDLGSGVEDLSVECDAVIDEATATPIDRRPRLREVQEGTLRGKKVPAHLFPPDIEPEVPNESFVYAKDGIC
ncbi:hypothetical protein FQA39_LY09429 [Lamprigera yunnana]|nr:hypothetical protein FQA39_LY09429 [Lamprigera yunnana]